VLNTDRWFYGVFQSAPDLIRWLVEPSLGLVAPLGAVPLELDRQYRFSAPELKAGSHRLDGVLWPLGSETGSEDLPVLLLEVQMRVDTGFQHRLAAQTYRFLQLHPRIEHWRVVVITPHQRLQLGPVMPLRGFLDQVQWVSLEELGEQENLDPAGGRQAGLLDFTEPGDLQAWFNDHPAGLARQPSGFPRADKARHSTPKPPARLALRPHECCGWQVEVLDQWPLGSTKNRFCDEEYILP
jgi:hypothetical protein